MKTTKRLMTAMLAIAMLMSIMATSAFAATTFTDVPESDWAYTYVEKAYANGLVSGTGNNKYNPDANVSNAEWSQMIANLFFGNTLAKAMENDPWWWPALEYASNQGFFVGTVLHETGIQVSHIPYKTDVVTATINRYDMAQVIYNVANSPRLDVGTVNTTGISASIADYQKIPAKYRPAVEFCYAAGFITGVDSNGTFAGTSTMTRGAAATVLCRLLDAKNGTWVVPTNGNTEKEKPVITNTVVKDMIKVTDSTRSGCNYDIAVSNTFTTGKLANGKDINATNIAAMLAELKAIYPAGTSWAGDGSTGDVYYYSHSTNVTGIAKGGCGSFAGMTADVLFGVSTKWTSSTDIYKAKPGDLIEFKDKNGVVKHWAVVMSNDGTQLTVCEGNINGEVRWETQNNIAYYLSGYPNSVLYTAY